SGIDAEVHIGTGEHSTDGGPARRRRRGSERESPRRWSGGGGPQPGPIPERSRLEAGLPGGLGRRPPPTRTAGRHADGQRAGPVVGAEGGRREVARGVAVRPPLEG